VSSLSIREDQLHALNDRRSPFFSAGFINRLQKMIRPERGPPTEIERGIERVLRRIAEIFAALGR
jgi:hypothetical protein